MKKIVLPIAILLFIFNSFLFGNATAEAVNNTGTVEVALESFGTFSIILMVGLSSLLGAFFLKDELPKTFES